MSRPPPKAIGLISHAQLFGLARAVRGTTPVCGMALLLDATEYHTARAFDRSSLVVTAICNLFKLHSEWLRRAGPELAVFRPSAGYVRIAA
jgi:hypothetical protein